MKSAVVLSIAALATAAPKPAGISTVELGARHDIEWTDELLNAHLDELAEKYEVEIPTSRKRATSGSIPLTDEAPNYPLDKSYYADGQVNTQTFSIKYDTGSKTFYVPGPKCPASECTGNVKYNEQGEDEHNVTSTNFGGTGAGSSRTGETFLDTVTVAGVAADKTQVVSMTQRVGKPQIRAIMGMSFGLLAGKPATYFEAAMAQGKVAANEFAFFLGRVVSGTGAKSEMTIGGRNPAKWTGDLVTLPVVQYDHWNVKLDGFVQNGELIPNTSGVATMDTGTSFIIGPYEQAAAFWAGIPGSIKHRETSAPYDVYEYPCNSKFTTSLRLNGHDFEISPKDYNIKYLLKGGLCLGFVGGGPFETWIVGDSFLKNWYSIYSYDAADGKPAVLLGAGKA